MTFITESRQPRGIGFLPLQHEFFQNQNWTLDQRVSILALRITSRRLPSEGAGNLGHYVFEDKSVGDLHGGLLWYLPEDGSSDRPIPGWRFIWPAISAPFQGIPTAGGGTCLSLDPYEILPVVTPFWLADTRYKSFNSADFGHLTPRWDGFFGEPKWPKPARGMYGLMIASDDEHQQIEYFYQTDPRMIAQHVFGDPKMSSMICDLGEGNIVGDSFAVSRQRMARMHTFWRVIWGPAFTNMPIDTECPTDESVSEQPPCDAFGNLDEFNSLAWQHMPHVCQHTGWGLVIDQKPKLNVKGEGAGAGPGDSLRAAAFGAPYSIGMCSMYEGGFFAPAPDHDKHRVGIDGDNNKIFSQHLSTLSLFRLPFDPALPGDVIIEGDGEIIETQPSYDGPLAFELQQIPNLVADLPFESRVILGWDKCDSYTWNCGNIRFGKWKMWGFNAEGASESHTMPVLISSDRDYRLRLGYLWTPLTRAHTALMFRPIAPVPGALDLRHAVRGDQWGPHKKELIDCFNKTSPMTIRVEAFARMNQPGGLEFDYNIEPESMRWPGGTAPGGIAFMAPELDILDEANDFNPLDQSWTPSVAHIVATRRVFWAVGTPDFTTGGIRSGHRWGRDADNSRLLFSRVDSSGIAVSSVALDDDGTARHIESTAFNLRTLARIGADVNDYSPGVGTFFRLSSDATRSIAGIAGGTDGRMIVLVNIDSNQIRLQNEDARSAAANRIITGTATFVILRQDDSALLIYDSTTARWRVIP